MRNFESLVEEAVSADVTGWGFDWLKGRAEEERPPWGFARMLAGRMANAGSALDLDTGGGEVLSEVPVFPERIVATESWPPNARRAAQLLAPRGVEVVETAAGAPLPFPDGSFELVTARHPVRPDWEEIRRLLVPGGRYFAQHVGPASAMELTGIRSRRSGRQGYDGADLVAGALGSASGRQLASCRGDRGVDRI